MKSCLNLAQLLQAEMPVLKEEIIRHKYFMSQRTGYDVGMEIATRDFLNNHLKDWAQGYKDCYCRLVCKERNRCGMLD